MQQKGISAGMADDLIRDIEAEASRLGLALRPEIEALGIHWTSWLRWKRTAPKPRYDHMVGLSELAARLRARKRAA